MAKPDAGKQIFDRTPNEIEQFVAGNPVSASHLNKIVDVSNSRIESVTPPSQINRTTKSDSIELGVVRGWPDNLGDVLDISLVERDVATGEYLILESDTVDVITWAGLFAQQYGIFSWMAPPTAIYPLVIPRWVARKALPIFRVGGERVCMLHGNLHTPDPLPANFPMTDAWHTDGEGVPSFAIAP